MLPLDQPSVRESLGRNLTVGVLDQVGKAIVTGYFDGRPFPTEAHLEAQYQVSRSVVREAVKMLTAKGLLSARPRQGTIVQPRQHWNLFDKDVLRWLLERKFSLGLLRQFTDLRIAIEPKGAALAAENATPDGLERLQAAFERMVQTQHSVPDAIHADIDFHVAILEASGNPFFSQFRDVVSTALQTSIKYTGQVAGATTDLPQHEAVMAAIIDRDADAAYARMFQLIKDVLTLIQGQEERAGGAKPSSL